MRVAKVWGVLLALALAAPAALAAQEPHGRAGGGGFMGIGFEWDDGNDREARVGQVVPGSGAERAGVRRGDRVVRIDGQPATEETVDRLRERLSAGDTVRLRLRRDGRELDQAVVAGEAPERHVFVIGDDDEDEVITLRVPRGEMRVRMDTLRRHLERLHSHMDSLRGRLELLHGDSGLAVFRVGPEGHAGVHPRDGARFRVFELDTLRRHFRIDSMVVVNDSVWAPLRAMERIEAFPYMDLDPEVPFYMELGRRGVAGAELAEMNSGLGRYFRTSTGVLVLEVSEGTPMARAGVQAGDVIVRAGDAAVRSVGELRRAMTAAGRDGKLRLEVMRQGSTRSVEMQWEPVRWRAAVPDRAERVRARQERTRGQQERTRERQEREPANP